MGTGIVTRGSAGAHHEAGALEERIEPWLAPHEVAEQLGGVGGVAAREDAITQLRPDARIEQTLLLEARERVCVEHLGTALATGLLFGVLPARRAAQLDPVAALARR